MNIFKKIQHSAWYIKLTHWEYWSFNTIYYPIIAYWFFLSLKARSFFFFNAANPSIKYGGFLMESKWDVAQILPAQYTPLTAIVRKNDSIEQVLELAEKFQFPIICKPDMGSRGRGVAVVQDTEALLAYHQQCPLDFLMQEKINFPMEAGIFYVKIPGEQKGRITGIVEKEFLSVVGDGRSSIRQLVLKTDRYRLQVKQLETLLGKELEEILAKGEVKLLVPFGNHARGCRFYDSTFKATERLSNAMEELCRAIPGFYFGRLDIRFESWDKLEILEDFSIIELNGAGSEPTHMYDTGNSLVDAWKQILRHHRYLYRVSRANHQRGHKYLRLAEARKMFSENKKIDAVMDKFLFESPAKGITTNLQLFKTAGF